MLSISQGMSADIYDIADKYGNLTSSLYERAENAKNMISYLKETNPIKYNKKVAEINNRVLGEVQGYEENIRTDATNRMSQASTAIGIIQGNIKTNEAIVSAQIERDIASGQIYKIPEAEMIKLAQLTGTTPASIRARADSLIDTSIAQAITSSGKTFSASQVASFTAQARSLVRSGLSPANAITQVLQANNIKPDREIQIGNTFINRDTNQITDYGAIAQQNAINTT